MAASSAIVLLYLVLSVANGHITSRMNNTYNPITSLIGVYLSSAAYCDANVIVQWSCPYCVHFPLRDVEVVSNKTTEVQSFVGYDAGHNRVIVAFRGSQNIPNWIHNLDARKTSYVGAGHQQCLGLRGEQGCEVHHGFWTSYASVRAALLARVKKMLQRKNSRKLLVVGHSLGAALAQLAGVEYAVAFPSVQLEVYNYGQPRIGNDDMAFWVSTSPLKGILKRVTHHCDVVPHLPLLNLHYRHSMHEVWYNNDKGGNAYTRCDDTPVKEASNCIDSHSCLSIEDHKKYMGVPVAC